MTVVVESSSVQLNGAVAEPKLAVKTDDKGADKPVEKPIEAAEVDQEADDLDLSAEERQGLTTKMLKAIGKKHRAMKEAEEFGRSQFSERKLAEERAESYQAEVDRLKEQLAQATKPDPDAGKPARDKYATEAEYQDALIDWKVEKRTAEREAEAQKRAQQERQAEIINTAKARIAKASELQPDFQEVLEAADSRVPDAVASYMQESDLFGELAYHLAKHPADVERLSKLSINRQLFEIAKIESRLSPFSKSDTSDSTKVPDAKSGELKDGDKPSTTVTPSKPRAPVITPLNSSSAQVEKSPEQRTVQDSVQDFQKKTGNNLYRRERH